MFIQPLDSLVVNIDFRVFYLIRSNTMSRERDGSDDRSNGKSSRHHDYLVKIRGISSLSSKEDIKKFLHRKLGFIISSNFILLKVLCSYSMPCCCCSFIRQ
jgi:hypothetical protein